MKKITITIFVLLSSLLFAQTEQQNIELPDFVITGKQNVNVPIAVKKKPDFISTLSRDFFTPQIAPEELPLLISSDPVPVRPEIKKFNDFVNGTLKVQIGNYSLPVGDLVLNQSYENYLVNARLWGSNIKEYIPNAGYNNSGVAMRNDVFLSTKSDFLPGAKLKIAADYIRDSYKLFASQTPTLLRETNKGSAIFSLASSYNRWVNFGFELNGNILSLNENKLKETNFSSKGLFEFKQNNFVAGINGSFSMQKLTNNLSGIDSYNFYSTEGYIKVFPDNTLNFILGINYAANSSNSFFAPFGSLEYKLDKGLTLNAGFNPHVEYFNVSDFLKRNIYFNPGLIDNIFSKYTTDFNVLIKYEYEKSFSLSFKGVYSKVSNYFYYDDAVNAGKFDLSVLPDAKIISAGINLKVYPEQYGYIFGNLLYKNASDQFDNIIPYEPELSTSVTYGYNFYFGLGFKIRYAMAFNVYTDITNSNKLDNYNDISLTLNYEIFTGLKLTADFQNILNRTNFVWKQYQEKPFDVLFGVEYRW
ncbi:MAG: hypothetical protein NTX65_04290 [Ignavibacteriales bacterium]|nr:hypothetical protein [Ignavibacteriales bacterium]